jgi:hypothetical protein
LPPILRQAVKIQNSSKGEFESWDCLAESSRRNLSSPPYGG